MLGKIIGISEGIVKIKSNINIYDMDNIIGKNVVFNGKCKIIGEIVGIKEDIISISLMGEIINNEFTYSDINKPAFSDECSLITKEELDVIFKNKNNEEEINLGKAYIYPDYHINLDINSFFSNHFSILGNTGSGKSYSVARIIQNIFYNFKKIPYRSNIFIFDAYGEYQNAFSKIGERSVNINYKAYTTNLKDEETEVLKIPFWLLGVDDIALLLNVTDRRQIPILEKALKLVSLFSKNEEEIMDYKNDIIARSLLDIIFSGKNNAEIRTKILSILSKFNTSKLSADSPLTEPGWTKTLRQCLYVDEKGKIASIELVTNFLQSLIKEDLELNLPDGSYTYSINDYYMALEFALISEGILNSDRVFDYANILKVRLNYLINSDYVNYFTYNEYIAKSDYIKKLLTTNDNKKAQVINFNINYVDDRFAKNIVKIYSKLLFDYITNLKHRASLPVHIILEEAHRYVQNDTDIEILGYNIFERITKEGRKYGIILGIISQRPSELSETALSQSSNFLIFKMFHPGDIKFINDIIPNINTNITDKIKTLHPGVCMAFGVSFNLPILVKLDKPDPEPSSTNANIVGSWYVEK